MPAMNVEGYKHSPENAAKPPVKFSWMPIVGHLKNLPFIKEQEGSKEIAGEGFIPKDVLTVSSYDFEEANNIGNTFSRALDILNFNNKEPNLINSAIAGFREIDRVDENHNYIGAIDYIFYKCKGAQDENYEKAMGMLNKEASLILEVDGKKPIQGKTKRDYIYALNMSNASLN
jgi:hypothetical protein